MDIHSLQHLSCSFVLIVCLCLIIVFLVKAIISTENSRAASLNDLPAHATVNEKSCQNKFSGDVNCQILPSFHKTCRKHVCRRALTVTTTSVCQNFSFLIFFHEPEFVRLETWQTPFSLPHVQPASISRRLLSVLVSSFRHSAQTSQLSCPFTVKVLTNHERCQYAGRLIIL